MALKALAPVLLLLLLSACSSVRLRHPSSAENPEPRIINHSERFRSFLLRSGDKSQSEKLRLWDEIIERPDQELYERFIWFKGDMPNWEERKRKNLVSFLPEYPKHQGAILELFSRGNEIIHEGIKTFRAAFPEAQLSTLKTFYVVPTPSLSGRVGVWAGEMAMVLGVDFLVIKQNDPKILLAHELTHIYHFEKLNTTSDEFLKDSKVTHHLWMEGLASVVSHRLNPGSSLADILGSAEFGRVPKSLLPHVAAEFLKDIESSVDPSKIERKWFRRGDAPMPGLPERSGYWLGYFVTMDLVKSAQDESYLNWEKDEIHRRVMDQLKIIARGQ